jgi:hypothetical protein
MTENSLMTIQLIPGQQRKLWLPYTHAHTTHQYAGKSHHFSSMRFKASVVADSRLSTLFLGSGYRLNHIRILGHGFCLIGKQNSIRYEVCIS